MYHCQGQDRPVGYLTYWFDAFNVLSCVEGVEPDLMKWNCTTLFAFHWRLSLVERRKVFSGE
jgi:hypothetical protein